MKTSLRTRGLDGLAQRLAARYLPASAAQGGARAAAELAEEITVETGLPAATTGQAGAAGVHLDPTLAATRRGGPDRPGDPTLDRLLLAFARRRR